MGSLVYVPREISQGREACEVFQSIVTPDVPATSSTKATASTNDTPAVEQRTDDVGVEKTRKLDEAIAPESPVLISGYEEIAIERMTARGLAARELTRASRG